MPPPRPPRPSSRSISTLTTGFNRLARKRSRSPLSILRSIASSSAMSSRLPPSQRPSRANKSANSVSRRTVRSPSTMPISTSNQPSLAWRTCPSMDSISMTLKRNPSFIWVRQPLPTNSGSVCCIKWGQALAVRNPQVDAGKVMGPLALAVESVSIPELRNCSSLRFSVCTCRLI